MSVSVMEVLRPVLVLEPVLRPFFEGLGLGVTGLGLGLEPPRSWVLKYVLVLRPYNLLSMHFFDLNAKFN